MKPRAVCVSQGATEIKTLIDSAPRPPIQIQPHIDTPLTWLLSHVSTSSPHRPQFSIDRLAASCRTPLRNAPVQQALEYSHRWRGWCEAVRNYVLNRVFPIQPNNERATIARDGTGLFVPVLSLMETPSASANHTGLCPFSLVHAINEMTDS